MIIVSGPEGCGTSYLWRNVKGITNMGGVGHWKKRVWKSRQFPRSGCHHISLPSLRNPERWLNEAHIPKDTVFLFAVRDKAFAASSSVRRFGGTEEAARERYERAIDKIVEFSDNHKSLTVAYRSLGDEKTRQDIAGFVGCDAEFQWEEFSYKGG